MDTLYFHGGAAVGEKDEYKTFKASKTELYEMGIPDDNVRMVSTLDELRTTIPNIVVAEGVRDIPYVQERFKQQEIKRKHRYVMSLGIFEQLHYHTYWERNQFGGEKFVELKILKPAKIKFKNLYKPYRGQDLTDKTLFVSRTGGVGDLLFIQPSLRYLKEKYPSCKVVFSCGPQYHDMIDSWDCIDEIADLPYSVQHLWNSDYHAIFEGVIERCFEAHSVNAYILFSRWLGLDLSDDLLIPKQKAKEEKVTECKFALEKLKVDGDFIIAQLRASSPVRTPRPEVWVSLFNELTDRGHKIVITDVPRKKEVIDEVIKLVKNPDMIFNFAGESKNVGYLIALTSLSKMALSCDTALMHIAESLGVKSFGIYGAFPGRIRLSTYKNCQWIESKLGCAPCYKHGHEACFNNIDGYGKCYEQLDIKYTVDKIEEHLTKGEEK